MHDLLAAWKMEGGALKDDRCEGLYGHELRFQACHPPQTIHVARRFSRF